MNKQKKKEILFGVRVLLYDSNGYSCFVITFFYC